MGAGAAFIMPATLSLLTSVFTDARERAMAIGIWAATAGVGVALGPVVGGFLLDHFWWGSVFIVNVPIVAAAIITRPAARSRVARPRRAPNRLDRRRALRRRSRRLRVGDHRGAEQGLDVCAGARRAVRCQQLRSCAFVAWERRVDEPLLDVRLFRNARFTAASITVTVLFFALFGFLFLSTQYLQFVLGYSPSAAGLRMLPYAGAMIVAAPMSSKLVARFGTKRVVTAGMLTFATGLAIAATITTTTGYGRLAIAMLFMGAGMGLAGAPATESIMGALPRDRAGIGSAVNDTTRELGGALGVAIVGSIVSSLYSNQLALPENVPAPVADAARESLGAAVQISGELGTQVADAAREAFVHAMSPGIDRRRVHRRLRGPHRLALPPGACCGSAGRRGSPRCRPNGRCDGRRSHPVRRVAEALMMGVGRGVCGEAIVVRLRKRRMPNLMSHPVPTILGRKEACQWMVVPPLGAASRSTSAT